MKLRFTIAAVVLLILALGFNAMLTLSSLEKLYVVSIVSKYSIVGKSLQRKIEKALGFGKSIQQFIGMDILLAESKGNLVREIDIIAILNDPNYKAIPINPINPDDITISIVMPEGLVLYSTEKTMENSNIPLKILSNLLNPSNKSQTDKSQTEFSYVKYKNAYYMTIPIFNKLKNSQDASIMISFDEKQVKDLFHSVLIRNVAMISIILGIGTFVLVLWLYAIKIDTAEISRLPKFKIYVAMMLVIGICQIVFTGLNTNDFKEYYLQISKEKIAVLTTLLREDIEFLLKKGLRIDKLVRMDVMLGEIINASPELENITIMDRNGMPLYMGSKKGVIDFQNTQQDQRQFFQNISEEQTDSKYNIIQKIVKDQNVEGYVSAESYEGTISTNISRKILFDKLRNIALDSATVLFISFLFFIEMLILIFQVIENKIVTYQQTPSTTNYVVMRPIAFLFFLGIDICISFLPLHMETIYEPIFGLSKDIVMGLPISMQMFCTAISILIAGNWCDRRGWHEPFLFGLFLSGIGFIYSWIAPSALHFIFSFGLVGFGYGLSLMSCQGFVVAHTKPEKKAEALAQLYAGIYAGSICGSAVGGMLAERLGYGPVFFIGAIILFGVIFYTIVMLRYAMHKPSIEIVNQKVTFKNFIRFVFNRDILGLLLLISIPSAIALVGFLNYLTPIYLKQIGTSQSNIGRILMIYGVCLVYISPIVTKWIGKSKQPKLFIVVSSILLSLTFINFYYFKEFSGLAAMSLSVFLLGLSYCFIASRNVYAMNLKASIELGTGKAMGLYYSISRIGQVLGPIIFGWLLIIVGLDHTILIMGTSILICTLLFFLLRGPQRSI